METDSSGTELKDGDYVLITGDGIAAFPIENWSAGIVRFSRMGSFVEPVSPSPLDGFIVTLPVGYRMWKIDYATVVALTSPQEVVSERYEQTLEQCWHGDHTDCLHT
jgi:hypothetical protein